jgi:site-specific recombinase XerD
MTRRARATLEIPTVTALDPARIFEIIDGSPAAEQAAALSPDAAAPIIPNAAQLAPLARDGLLADLQAAKAYASRDRARNTQRAYDSDWIDFARYCTQHEIACLPAEPIHVAAYLAHLADGCSKCGRAEALARRTGQEPKPHRGQHTPYKLASLRRRLAVISLQHRIQNHPSPASAKIVQATISGIAERYGSAQRGKASATLDIVQAMLKHTPKTIAGARDRAILLVGFASALRRAELAQLTIADLEITIDGMQIFLKRSKTDQHGEGRYIFIARGQHAATCPIRAVQAWQIAAELDDDAAAGPLFRPIDRHGNVKPQAITGEGIARIVKRYAAACGLNARDFGAHSLRAGLVTSARDAGIDFDSIMDHTGHKTRKVVKVYDRGKARYKNALNRKIGM